VEISFHECCTDEAFHALFLRRHVASELLAEPSAKASWSRDRQTPQTGGQDGKHVRVASVGDISPVGLLLSSRNTGSGRFLR